MKNYRPLLACLALLVLGLALRLPGLGSFLTPDEGDWGRNTAQFATALLHRDWAGTLTVPYPGVTTTWAGTIGLALKWSFDRPPQISAPAGLVQALAGRPNRTDLLPWLRLPVVIICVLGLLAIYLLARRLVGGPTALLAAGLLTFDPFFLAHSRLIQTDALLATFLTIAWLALLAGDVTRQRRYDVLSGLALAGAVLTKSPALTIAALAVAWIAWRSRRSAHAPALPARWDWRGGLRRLLWLGLPALAACWLLWPALWQAPMTVAGRVWGLMRAFSQTSHELGNFWLGQPVDRPGALFYPAVLLWRTTPVTLAGLLLAAVFTLWPRRSYSATGSVVRSVSGVPRAVIAGMWLFVAWFTLLMALGDKQFDRYLLPVFPMLDLLAAWGWVVLARVLLGAVARHRQGSRGAVAAKDRPGPGRRPAWAAAAGLLLVAGQAASALAARPNYLSAFNPLLGGIAGAQRVMLVGWGEGLAEAAQFLNGQPTGAGGQAAAWYGQNVFGAFYRGRSYDLYYDARTAADLYAHDVDYVITYVNQDQRQLLDASVREQLGAPIYASHAGPVALAEVYRWPKPFAHTADRPLAPGLRLRGWELGEASAGGGLAVTVYWDAAELAAQAHGAPVRAWLKDTASGEVWSTAQELAQASTAAPAAGWLDRPVAAQRLLLRLPAGLAAGAYQVEMAPLAGQGLALGAVQVPATPRAALARTAPDGWQPVAGQVVFNTDLQLAGYALQSEDGALAVDLLWAPGTAGAPDCQFFIHLVGPDNQILAQADGPLGLPTAPVVQGRQAGDVVRQRIHVRLPAGTPASGHRVYLGLYQPGGGPRLPLAVDGSPVADGRYLLATASH